MTTYMIGSIKKHAHSQDKIFLCPPLSTQLEKGDTISIHYGKEIVKATVIPIKNTQVVSFSENLWNALAIPFAHKLHLKLKDKSLHIGPLVGIFTTGTHDHPESPVGTRTRLFKHFIRVQNEVHASYFVFGPSGIDPYGGRIQGYFLRNHRGKFIWKKYSVPFPDVVFDRVPNRNSEKISEVIQSKQILKSHGVKTFNPGFFNKWTIHEQIHHSKEVQAYIPETIFNPNLKQLGHLLKKHGMIYLKPAGGSLGLGIVQFIYKPEKGIYSRYCRRDQNHLTRFTKLSSALQYFFGSKTLDRYIAQQGIQLIQYGNRTVDFRVHTNKDRSGHWKMTAIAAKMAGKGSVTTHMRTGGEVISYLEVIRHCFPPSQRQNKVLTNLESAVITLSECIEENLPGYIGELGFDIGIDESGHPWMFEANSKPGRHVFSHSSMRESDYVTRKMILDYALHLADFTTKE